MDDLDRRSLLKVVAGLALAPSVVSSQVPAASSQVPAPDIHIVSFRADRTGVPHKAVRADSHLDFKVLSGETNGGVFIMENRDMVRGGPPRHVHLEQEEWFFLIEGGDVLIEIGERKLRLKPGDSVLAPRNVPHVWAYIGDRPGRMLFAFSPAARIESFFEETSKPGARPDDPHRFEAHGMKLVGPPLVV